MYDPERHHRRSVRLAGYDYAEAGAYFVTVCTQGHVCLFGEVVDGQMRMNAAGDMVQAVWDELPSHYPGASTDAFIVMPNHVHGIIVLAPVGAGPRARLDSGPRVGPDLRDGSGPFPHRQGMAYSGEGRPQGVAPTSYGPLADGDRGLSLGEVVARFKSLTTRRYIEGVRQSGWRAFRGRLWQRSYYDHIIRNERALSYIRRYVIENPLRWAQDRENPAANGPDAPDAGQT